ncbi:hypothetical protein Tco_1361109 [Tanacetum coccineum]
MAPGTIKPRKELKESLHPMIMHSVTTLSAGWEENSQLRTEDEESLYLMGKIKSPIKALESNSRNGRPFHKCIKGRR